LVLGTRFAVPRSPRLVERRVGATIAAVALAVALVSGQATPQLQAPFMLGVLKQDAAMQPLFHYAGSEWTTPWQYEADARPSSVETIPAS
jgi:hypothetical protein